jgi:chromosome segregation ATPase
MALIFAVPAQLSPFCVMDEVDAPLDEFSPAAFTGLVRELKQARSSSSSRTTSVRCRAPTIFMA